LSTEVSRATARESVPAPIIPNSMLFSSLCIQLAPATWWSGSVIRPNSPVGVLIPVRRHCRHLTDWRPRVTCEIN
jgi:hypothetical protein